MGNGTFTGLRVSSGPKESPVVTIGLFVSRSQDRNRLLGANMISLLTPNHKSLNVLKTQEHEFVQPISASLRVTMLARREEAPLRLLGAVAVVLGSCGRRPLRLCGGRGCFAIDLLPSLQGGLNGSWGGCGTQSMHHSMANAFYAA